MMIGRIRVKYFIDYFPTTYFTNELINNRFNTWNDESIDKEIILNIYIKQLPSMNINFGIYIDKNNIEEIIINLQKNKFKINIMFDALCLGNIEFGSEGKNIIELIDRIIMLKPDYITLTNHFYFNYIKQKYPNINLVFSDYSGVDNVQKIYRHLEELKCNGLKISINMAKNKDLMHYLKNNFFMESIHLDINKNTINNNIFEDSLNYNISHYIQKDKSEEIVNLLENFNEHVKLKGLEINSLNFEDLSFLYRIGLNNIWINSNYMNDKQYYNCVYKFINEKFDKTQIYPLDLAK